LLTTKSGKTPAGTASAWRSKLPALAEILVVEGLDLSITGFSPVEIDQLTVDFEEDASDPDDAIDSGWTTASAVSNRGDLWELGKHRLLCGDARNADPVTRLMGGAPASMAFLDPPYNGFRLWTTARNRVGC
jgi:hypothetical protein